MEGYKKEISEKPRLLLHFFVLIFCIAALFIVNKGTTEIVMAENTKGYSVKAKSNGTLSCSKKDSKGKTKTLKNTYVSIKKSGKSYKIVPQSTAGGMIYKFDSKGIGKKYTKAGFVKITYNSSVKNLYVKGGVSIPVGTRRMEISIIA